MATKASKKKAAKPLPPVLYERTEERDGRNFTVRVLKAQDGRAR
jgi:hypothetical protein